MSDSTFRPVVPKGAALMQNSIVLLPSEYAAYVDIVNALTAAAEGLALIIATAAIWPDSAVGSETLAEACVRIAREALAKSDSPKELEP